MHDQRTKRIGSLLVALLCSAATANAQTTIKVNAVPLALGMPHFGVETRLGGKLTAQLDVAASFWQSFGGPPFEVLMVVPEIRHYFRESMRGPYIGVHVGAAAFRLQKWNYWGTSRYQEGYTVLAGVTLGVAQRITEQWTLDWFVGGGNQQARYRGLDWALGGAEYVGLNRSGEWLPYRGGVMLSYALPRPGSS
jgi:hypothetical protein